MSSYWLAFISSCTSKLLTVVRTSWIIQVSQQAKAATTGAIGKKTTAATQNAKKSIQRLNAAANRFGGDAAPGEYKKDFTPRNQPFAIKAAINTRRGGGLLSISGWSSWTASSAVSPATKDFSISLHAYFAVGLARVPLRFSAEGTDRHRYSMRPELVKARTPGWK